MLLSFHEDYSAVTFLFEGLVTGVCMVAQGWSRSAFGESWGRAGPQLNVLLSACRISE